MNDCLPESREEGVGRRVTEEGVGEEESRGGRRRLVDWSMQLFDVVTNVGHWRMVKDNGVVERAKGWLRNVYGGR